jgi:hypothetical protein
MCAHTEFICLESPIILSVLMLMYVSQLRKSILYFWWEIWGSHSLSDECSNLLECDTMWISMQIMTLWRSLLPPSLGYSSALRMEPLYFLLSNFRMLKKHIMYINKQHVGYSVSTRTVTRSGTGWSMVYPNINWLSQVPTKQNSTWKDIM